MHEVIRDSDPSVYTTSSRRIIPSPRNCSPIISDWRDRNPPPDGIVRDGLRNLHFHLASLSENTLRRYQRDLRIAMRDLLPGVSISGAPASVSAPSASGLNYTIQNGKSQDRRRRDRVLPLYIEVWRYEHFYYSDLSPHRSWVSHVHVGGDRRWIAIMRIIISRFAPFSHSPNSLVITLSTYPESHMASSSSDNPPPYSAPNSNAPTPPTKPQNITTPTESTALLNTTLQNNVPHSNSPARRQRDLDEEYDLRRREVEYREDVAFFLLALIINSALAGLYVGMIALYGYIVWGNPFNAAPGEVPPGSISGSGFLALGGMAICVADTVFAITCLNPDGGYKHTCAGITSVVGTVFFILVWVFMLVEGDQYNFFHMGPK
jgi:hypothetical protein